VHCAALAVAAGKFLIPSPAKQTLSMFDRLGKTGFESLGFSRQQRLSVNAFEIFALLMELILFFSPLS
jgi:hypothetical protein